MLNPPSATALTIVSRGDLWFLLLLGMLVLTVACVASALVAWLLDGRPVREWNEADDQQLHRHLMAGGQS